jgi:mono/diheme cytochrome c family protein
MKAQLRQYNLYRLVMVANGLLLLSASQASDSPAKNAIVLNAVQVQPSTPTSAEHGQELYRTNCAFCHGDYGERGANPLKNAVEPVDDTVLTETILNGVPEKGMPIMEKLENE